jgi:hypothetical protein
MPEFYHSSPFGVLQDIALFEKPDIIPRNYIAPAAFYFNV